VQVKRVKLLLFMALRHMGKWCIRLLLCNLGTRQGERSASCLGQFKSGRVPPPPITHGGACLLVCKNEINISCVFVLAKFEGNLQICVLESILNIP